MIFVDTNYFLRFFLKDIPDQYEKALKLFEDGAAGKTNLGASIIVFFEIYWVFTSYYKKTKKEVIIILNNLLQMKFVRFEQEKLLAKTLNLYAKQNIDLEDAYNIIYAKYVKASDFKTFDQKTIKVHLRLK